MAATLGSVHLFEFFEKIQKSPPLIWSNAYFAITQIVMIIAAIN